MVRDIQRMKRQKMVRDIHWAIVDANKILFAKYQTDLIKLFNLKKNAMLNL